MNYGGTGSGCISNYREGPWGVPTHIPGSCYDYPRILRTGMAEECHSDLLYLALRTYQRVGPEDAETMCKFIKRYLDEEYGPTWHVLIGRFGA